MAYDPNSPSASQLLSVSQPIIQGNFALIQTAFDQNHADFNSANPGKHLFTEFLTNANSPPTNVPGGIPAGEVMLYSFVGAFSANAELYVNKTNQATAKQIPMTASILSSNSNPGNIVSGWTYLPSGIIMKWGSGVATGSTPFNFPVGATIPVFTAVMSMQVCTAYANAADGNSFARLSAFDGTSFVVYGSQRTTTTPQAAGFQYLAIGY
jgi:hypothetical protein